jgi:transcriptional regulator with XRE-family HTH domain
MGNLEEQLGTRMKSLRLARSLPVEALAGHLGITELQVAGIEAGKQQLKPEHLLLVCELFGATVEEFMQGI